MLCPRLGCDGPISFAYRDVFTTFRRPPVPVEGGRCCATTEHVQDYVYRRRPPSGAVRRSAPLGTRRESCPRLANPSGAIAAMGETRLPALHRRGHADCHDERHFVATVHRVPSVSTRYSNLRRIASVDESRGNPSVKSGQHSSSTMRRRRLRHASRGISGSAGICIPSASKVSSR